MDLGELPGEPDEFYSLATMVNIACGGHAGDMDSMKRALELACAAGARVAAHPSYPDRENFGRKSIPITMFRLAESLRYQISWLMMMAGINGTSVVAVKPHGALYHDAADYGYCAEIFLTVVEYINETNPGANLAVVGPPEGFLKNIAHEKGLAYIREGFADRTYLPDGRLVPRSEPNALLTDPNDAAAQAVRLAQSGEFDTLCVHGDTPNALAVARAVRKALVDAQLLDGA